MDQFAFPPTQNNIPPGVWSTQAVLTLGGGIGVLLVVLDQFLISAVFRPLGYFLCGVKGGDLSSVGDDKHYVVKTKVPVWLESGVLHSIEFLFVLYYASQWTWWRNISGWPKDVLIAQHGSHHQRDEQERDEFAPFYTFYFGYVCFTFVRDVFLKQDRTGGNIMFTVHHVLTVGLVASSFHYGSWRAGFLTRLLLCLGEVTLYLGKVYGAREQLGNGSRPLLGCLFILNALVWGAMRCVCYAYLCYSNTVMVLREYPDMQRDTLAAYHAMLFGSWAMLFLQLLWTPFIFTAGMKFLRTGNFEDAVHRDNKRTDEASDTNMSCCSGAKCKEGTTSARLNANACEEQN